MPDSPDIPRYLLAALRHMQLAFEQCDSSSLATINENLQPVADAAMGWISSLRRDQEEAWRDRDAARRERDDLQARLVEAGDDYVRERDEVSRLVRERNDALARLGKLVMTDAARLAEVEAIRAQLADRRRLLDLVRHQRGALHEAGLISDEEYATLAGDHGAVARLEGYDDIRAERDEARRERDLWRQRYDDHAKELDAIASKVRDTGVDLLDGEGPTPLGLVAALVRERGEAVYNLAVQAARLAAHKADLLRQIADLQGQLRDADATAAKLRSVASNLDAALTVYRDRVRDILVVAGVAVPDTQHEPFDPARAPGEPQLALDAVAELVATLANERGDGVGPTPDWSYAREDSEWSLWHVPAGRHPSGGEAYSVTQVWDENTSRPFWMMFRGSTKLQIAPNGSSMVKHAREGMWLITRHLQEGT